MKLKSPIKSNSEVDKYWQLRWGNGAITRGESYPGAGHPQHSHKCWLLTLLAVLVVLFQFDLWIHQDRCCCFSSCTWCDRRLTLILRKSLDIWRQLSPRIWISMVTLVFNLVIFRDSRSPASPDCIQPVMVGSTSSASLACTAAFKKSRTRSLSRVTAIRVLSAGRTTIVSYCSTGLESLLKWFLCPGHTVSCDSEGLAWF